MPFQITASMCNGQTSSLSVRLEENLQGELPLDGKTSIDTASRLGWVLHHSSEDSLKDGRIIRRDSHLRPRMDEKEGLRFSYMSAKEDDSCDWKCMLLSGSVRSGDSDNTIFSKMTVAIQDREISTVINKIYPEIYSVKLVNDQLMVKVRGYDNLLPAKVAGDGVTRIISVLCSLWNCKDGCLCVDEIDNGLHYSVLLDFWDVVADFVDRFNVQLIATTHHLDLLETLSKMAMQRNKEDQVCYVRLAVDENGNHTVARFSGKDLDRALDMGFELRG